jgi:hypothetical protein
MSPEFIEATLTSLERLPTGEGMIPTKEGLLVLCTSQIHTPASGSPPQGSLNVPVCTDTRPDLIEILGYLGERSRTDNIAISRIQCNESRAGIAWWTEFASVVVRCQQWKSQKHAERQCWRACHLE